jgi:UDP-hydrolysing UDP-N-acetyl-D-glucosamine 2-epimerase
MKKICFVTAARSEYGLLKWLMYDVNESSDMQLQLIVTGGHLLAEQGHTIDQIIDDGFIPDAVVDVQLDTATTEGIAASMGRLAEQFAPAFARLQPDYLLVLGDRYELLPICNTAFVMRIPIIHLSGGDVTEGAIDDGVRNAVTMLAEYHFPGTQDSADNIVRMRGSRKNIWVVGEPGLDAFQREKLLDRQALAENLGLDVSRKWVLMTYHAETQASLEYNLATVRNCILALCQLTGYQVVATYANADFGGRQINEYLEQLGREEPEMFRVVPSLGHLRYLSFMKQAGCVIGNSSSGIVEAPSLAVPVVNIGDLDYWGTGHASEQIVKILSEVLSRNA